MRKNTAVLNRRGIALFNFMNMKHRNNKRIGNLAVRDFVEMCAFLAKIEFEKTDYRICNIFLDKDKRKSAVNDNQQSLPNFFSNADGVDDAKN
jgi:hypothetical protein